MFWSVRDHGGKEVWSKPLYSNRGPKLKKRDAVKSSRRRSELGPEVKTANGEKGGDLFIGAKSRLGRFY